MYADRVLFVLTNQQTLGQTGKVTGAYLAEVTHPYQVVTGAGYMVEFTNPWGGDAPFDPSSLDELDAVSQAFYENPGLKERLRETRPAQEVDAAR